MYVKRVLLSVWSTDSSHLATTDNASSDLSVMHTPKTTESQLSFGTVVNLGQGAPAITYDFLTKIMYCKLFKNINLH